MQRQHERALEEALAAFDCTAAGSMRARHRKKLVVDLGDHFEAFKSRRFLEAEMACLSMLQVGAAEKAELMAAISSASGSSSDNGAGRRAREWVGRFVESFEERMDGPSKYDLLSRFLVSCVEDLAQAVDDCKGEGQAAAALEEKMAAMARKHADDLVAKEAAAATLKEVLRAEQQHVEIRLRREQAKNKRLTVKVTALEKQLKASTADLSYTSGIVEKWAQEAAAAAKTPPPVARGSENMRTQEQQRDLCHIFHKGASLAESGSAGQPCASNGGDGGASMQDITNRS